MTASSRSAATKSRSRGFTLTELAVVTAIVGLLLASLMFTLSAQVDSRNFSETQRRLDEARELLLAYAIVNGRLPCPARSNSNGAEVRNSGTGECKNTSGTVLEDYYGGTLADGTTGGLLPAATIGFRPVDSSGFGLDAWGNRIRYALARSLDGGTCADSATIANFTLATKLKSNGIGCKPNDLIVCSETQATAAGLACNPTSTTVTNAMTVAAMVLSVGKNGATGPAGTNETENVDGDHLFVYRAPDPSGAAGGEFDDIVSWVPVALLYSRLISAAVLP